MSGEPRGIRRLFRLRAQSRVDASRDVDDEVRIHVALRSEQLLREGMSEAEAEAEARRLFATGNETLRALHATARQRNRHVRFRERWESWVHDARYAGRGLAGDWQMSVFIVVTLALGTGMNMTSFTVVDRLLLRDPAHVSDPDNVLRLYGTVTVSTERTSAWIPWPVYEAMHEGLSGFSSVGAYRVTEEIVGRGADARTLRVGQATAAFFEVLGTRPVRGRLFGAGEDAATTGPVAVVSEEMAGRLGGEDAAALGSSLTVGETAYTILGVVPAGFTGTELRRVDLWLLMDSRSVRTMNWLIVGRLQPGGSAAAITAEANAVHERTRATSPRWYREARLHAASIRYDDSGKEPFEATMARWLAAVSALILLVAFANVINLLLVRLARRRRELAVRIALGSGRARVMRLLGFEGLWLALLSGVAGLWIARLSEPVVRRALFTDQASWTFSLADPRVIGVAVAIVLVTALLLAIVPALHAGSPRLAIALRTGTRSDGGGNARIRGVLTVAQAALSVALLVGTGLFLRSMAHVNALDLGIDRDRVVVATTHLPRITPFRRYLETEASLHRRLVERVRALPGVERASFAIGLPLDGGSFSASIYLPGKDSVPVLSGRGPFASTVDGDYFATVGTRLIRGRVFTDSDHEGTEPVVIIGETTARTLWPDSDPLSACVSIEDPTSQCRRVVGIVADVHRVGLRDQPSLQYYMPHGQQQLFGGARLIVRPAPGAPVSWATLRQTILDVDPIIRAVDVGWLRDELDGEMRPLRLGMVTFGLSGALALLVAVLGLYSLMSYMVAWRTHEIGIRLAIGASDAQITRMVIRGGVGLAVLGVGIGLALAAAAGRWVEPHLFQTRALDPLVFAGVALTLVVVALAAGWLPARRALAISPTQALRSD